MNPYDNNPFNTDETKDTRSEYDANLRLRNTIHRVRDDIRAHVDTIPSDNWFERGYAMGLSHALVNVELDMITESTNMTEYLSKLARI